MPTIDPTVTPIRPNVARVQWVLGDGDDGRPYEFIYLPDRTAHIFGNFGAGGELTLEGSNELITAPPANWVTLRDFDANPIVVTGPFMALIAENPGLVRPRVTAGVGVTISIAVNAIVQLHGVAIGGVAT